MRNSIKKITVAAALVALAGCGGSGDGDIFKMDSINSGKTVVTVNGTDIREGMLNTLGDLSPRLKAQIDNPLTRKKILNSLVEQELLYQEAVKRGLNKKEDVKVKALLNQHTIIANSVLEDELENAMKKAFEERKDSEFTKVDISQIAVNYLPEADAKKGAKPTDEQKAQALEKAKAIKARLDKGEDFATVAKETSDDKRTSSKGGAAGQVTRDDKRFARLGLKQIPEAAFKLKKGEVSDPIETDQGYYLLKVTSDPVVTDYEDAKRILGFEMQSTLKNKLLDDLKKNSKIVYAGEGEKTESPVSAVPAKPDQQPVQAVPAPDAKAPEAAPQNH